MLSTLKYHPFAVDAFFERSLVLTYAVPKEQLEVLLPPPLSLDTYDDKYGFIAAALVSTKCLRPKGFPKFLGNDFYLVGYRVFVRYTNEAGKRLRGLLILKSETNKKKMELLGNIFTLYNYSTTDIFESVNGSRLMITSEKSGFSVDVDRNVEDVQLPESTPFLGWKEARRFAGPLPFTFTYLPEQKQVLIIKGMRQNWQPKPIHVISHEFSFINALKLKDVHLANAFIIEQVPYCWEKGILDKWQQEENHLKV